MRRVPSFTVSTTAITRLPAREKSRGQLQLQLQLPKGKGRAPNIPPLPISLRPFRSPPRVSSLPETSQLRGHEGDRGSSPTRSSWPGFPGSGRGPAASGLVAPSTHMLWEAPALSPGSEARAASCDAGARFSPGPFLRRDRCRTLAPRLCRGWRPEPLPPAPRVWVPLRRPCAAGPWPLAGAANPCCLSQLPGSQSMQRRLRRVPVHRSARRVLEPGSAPDAVRVVSWGSRGTGPAGWAALPAPLRSVPRPSARAQHAALFTPLRGSAGPHTAQSPTRSSAFPALPVP